MYNISMKNTRTQKIEFIKEFMNICKKENIWVAADKSTILGMVRHGGFIPWSDKFKVMMTPESYRKLHRLNPKRLVDSSFDSSYRKLKNIWVTDNTELKEDQPFIEISMIVPSTIKSINKYRSLSRITWGKMTFKRDNVKHAINDLYVEKNEGYYRISNRRDSLMENWIHNLSFKTVDLQFHSLMIPVPKEYKTLLVLWYGEDYMTAKIPTSYMVSVNPLEEEKVSQ